MDEGGRDKINIKVFYVVRQKILTSTKETPGIFSWANFGIFTHFSIHLQSTSKLWVVNHSWEGNWPVWHILTALTNLIICSNINRIQYHTTCSNLDTCTTESFHCTFCSCFWELLLLYVCILDLITIFARHSNLTCIPATPFPPCGAPHLL